MPRGNVKTDEEKAARAQRNRDSAARFRANKKAADAALQVRLVELVRQVEELQAENDALRMRAEIAESLVGVDQLESVPTSSPAAAMPAFLAEILSGHDQRESASPSSPPRESASPSYPPR